MSKTGGYTINVNQGQQTIDMAVKGTFTPEQAQNFHRDYQSRVGSITAQNFTLKVDCMDMNVITQDMLPKLQVSFEMYKASGFKNVQFLIKKSPVIKMQLMRVARNAGLVNAEVVEA